MKCLEELFHLKARIYALVHKESEAIKVLKKWKKLNSNTESDDLYAYYLIGFFYNKDGNPKEAVKWLKKVFNDLSNEDISICYTNSNLIFMSLFEIASIKFQQKEFQIAELIFKECHITFTDYKKQFTQSQSFREKCVENCVGKWNDRFERTKEILNLITFISKTNVKSANTNMPEDLLKIVKTLTLNRKKVKDDFEKSDPVLEKKLKSFLKAKQYGEAVQAYQTYYENMKLEKTLALANRPCGYGVTHKLPNFDAYCFCLFRCDMYEEALEFLHMGIQKCQVQINSGDIRCIALQYEMIRHLARSYCVIGDVEKSEYYMKLHRDLRQSYDFLDRSKDVISEEDAFISLKYCLFKSMKSGTEKKIIDKIEQYYYDGIVDGGQGKGNHSEWAKTLQRVFILLTMHTLHKIHVNMKKVFDITQAVTIVWMKLKELFDSRKNMYLFLFENMNPDFKFTLGILLLIVRHEINRLWKRMDSMFPENENHEEVMHFVQLEGKYMVATSKFNLNQGKAEIDKEYDTKLLDSITKPNYYLKMLIALRQMHYRIFISKFWNVFWENHPRKSDNGEKKKWRHFKNSASIILWARGEFANDQEYLTDDYKRYSSLTQTKVIPDDSESDTSDCESEYIPLPLRERIHFTKKFSSQDYQDDDQADETNDDASEQSILSSSSEIGRI